MDSWIRNYRELHPAAGRWAAGSVKVSHSEETQGRVFRMAEQLRAAWNWSSTGTLFSMLQSLDSLVDAETPRTARPTAISAAAAGVVGYRMLFGKKPPMRSSDWPEGFEPVDERETELATFGLRAHGFDPVVIDGIDPAAFVWALFEMEEREIYCAEVRRLRQHQPMEPRCLAIVPQETVRESTPERAPAHTGRQLVTAGS